MRKNYMKGVKQNGPRCGYGRPPLQLFQKLPPEDPVENAIVQIYPSVLSLEDLRAWCDIPCGSA